jgi:hypothetical protein
VREIIAVPQPALQEAVVAADEPPALCELPDAAWELLASDALSLLEPQAASARAPTTSIAALQVTFHR